MFTLEDFDLNGANVLVRCDLNSPIRNGEIKDDTKIKACIPTLNYLLDSNADITILSHQGRPFSGLIDLSPHSRELDDLLDVDVNFCDSVFSSHALEEIKNNDGVLVLNNTRLYSEEVRNVSLSKCENSYLVNKFSPNFDYFVNDAFGAIHRSQVSLIGFARKMPMISGKLMEKELDALKRTRDSEMDGTKTLILGGAKVDDSIKVIEESLKKDNFDYILTTGIVSLIFLLAKGYNLGDRTIGFIEENKLLESVRMAEELLEIGFEKIKTPVDLSMDWRGRYEINVTKLEGDNRTDKHLFLDIGERTVEKYGQIINNSDLIIMNGPAGKFEDNNFMKGTEGILEKISKSSGFSNVGGGHTVEAINKTGIKGFSHISTGGGAMLSYLSEEELPVLGAFKKSYNKFRE